MTVLNHPSALMLVGALGIAAAMVTLAKHRSWRVEMIAVIGGFASLICFIVGAVIDAALSI